jgi:dihydrofolate synthase/folylpolyglutamate synthase
VTAITPVSLDHQHFLGSTIAAIAGEKAGILKPGRPAVIGPQAPEAAEVIATRAAAIGAPLFRYGQEWLAAPIAGGGLRYEGRRWRLDLPPPGLLGRHQFDNAGTALACLDCFDGFAIGEAALARGLMAVEWPARLQRLVCGPLVDALPGGTELWLDGGHNEAGGEALARVARGWQDRPLRLVVGMLATHDARAFLRPFGGLAESVAAVAIPGETNSLPAEAVAAAAQQAGIAAAPCPDVAAAVRTAGDAPPGRVLVCGSLYLAGRVLRDNG